MIWSVVSKEEIENFGTSNVFKFYREALGRDNITLAIVDETDNLDFVSKDDIVLLRTASKQLIDTIRDKGAKTTAEDYDTYYLAGDKIQISRFLLSKGIHAPAHQFIDSVEDGKVYFVKPLYGSDSKGVTEKNICKSKEEVIQRVTDIDRHYNCKAIIEEFIDGKEYTVACFNIDGQMRTFPIEVDCSATFGIQTEDGKANYAECGIPLQGNDRNEINTIAKKAFGVLGVKHHARIDFRRGKDGKFYVIDVNLIPGLGPTGDLARCLLLTENYSYTDAVRMVIASATKI